MNIARPQNVCVPQIFSVPPSICGRSKHQFCRRASCIIGLRDCDTLAAHLKSLRKRCTMYKLSGIFCGICKLFVRWMLKRVNASTAYMNAEETLVSIVTKLRVSLAMLMARMLLSRLMQCKWLWRLPKFHVLPEHKAHYPGLRSLILLMYYLLWACSKYLFQWLVRATFNSKQQLAMYFLFSISNYA
jgi:hypothetical protein